MPVNRELRRVEEAAAARHDRSMWQYAILSVVDRRPGLNQAEVASALGYSKNRIVGDLDDLERAELLTRQPGTDRRANILAVTAAGRRIMTAIEHEIHRQEDELLAPLPAATRRMFVAALLTLNEQVRARG
jgi:DNA-binding MarR family transcriptional regulator